MILCVFQDDVEEEKTRSAIFRSSRSCPANLAQKVFDPIITSAIFSKRKEYDRAVR